jgi:hypothetical protein
MLRLKPSFYNRSHLPNHRTLSKRSGSYHSPLLSSSSSFNIGQSRYFFFGNSGNDDDDSKKGDNGKKDDKDDKKDDDKNPDEEQDKEPSPTLNNSSKYKSSPRFGGGNPNVLLPASRLGFGDQAPRYPHLMALPVIRGPVFPGVLTPVTVTDKVCCFMHALFT